MNELDLVIVGGCGHVGLPLALSLADCGYRVGINDIDQTKIEMVRAGHVPFHEAGAEDLLRKLLPAGRLELWRSTVFPGTTETVERRLRAAGIDADIAFCPERIAEGHALEELRTLPQLVGVNSDEAFARAKALFERMGVASVIR